MTTNTKPVSPVVSTLTKSVLALRARHERELQKEIAQLLKTAGAPLAMRLPKTLGARVAGSEPRTTTRAAKQTREQGEHLQAQIIAFIRSTPNVGMGLLCDKLADYTPGQIGYQMAALKEGGAIVQHGTRRAATYTVADQRPVITADPASVILPPPVVVETDTPAV